jgi:hypothetical protein
MLIDGHLLVGTTLMSYDDLHAGLDHLDRAIAQFPARPTAARTARVGNDPRISSLTTSGITLWLLGYPDQAAQRVDAALALAAQLDHPFTSAYARFHAGLVRLWLRDPDASLDLAVGLLDLADEHELRIWTAVGSCLLGAAEVDTGRADEGLAHLRTGIGLYGELRSPPIFWPFLLFVQARAAGIAGRAADGLGPLQAAIDILDQGGGPSFLPELHLVKGDLLGSLDARDGGGTAVAETWYRRALDRAIALDARTTQLRAATRLARLRLAEGDAAGAETLLGPIHAWFTEGLERPDQREAGDLLRSIRSA